MTRKKKSETAVAHAIRLYRNAGFFKEWLRARASEALDKQPEILTVRRCGSCKGKMQGRKHDNPFHLITACPFCGRWYYKGVDITINHTETRVKGSV